MLLRSSRLRLLRCMSLKMTHLGPPAMSVLALLRAFTSDDTASRNHKRPERLALVTRGQQGGPIL
jgi:hypothetical protein